MTNNELETTIRTSYAGILPESQIKATIRWWEDYLKKILKECLPEERKLFAETKPAGGYMAEMEELHKKQGFNSCRSQIIFNFEKFGIKI